MPAKIVVIGQEECPTITEAVAAFPYFLNTTSRSTTWTRNFSPFYLGPVNTYNNAPHPFAYTVENCWQYSRVYKDHLGDDGNPNSSWLEWARNGFRNRKAVRYPRGKGAIPEYAWWDGNKYGIIEARKKIYIPKYYEAVKETYALQKLIEMYNSLETLMLWDYDSYNRLNMNMSLEDVVNNTDRSMGHAFVIEMILDGSIEKYVS